MQVRLGHRLARCRQCGSAEFSEELRRHRNTAVLRCRECGRKTRRLYLALQIAEELALEAHDEAANGAAGSSEGALPLN